MKTFKWSFYLMFALIVPLASFTFVRGQKNYRIAVGIAYADMDCNGFTVKTARGYEYRAAVDGNIGEMVNAVKSSISST